MLVTENMNIPEDCLESFEKTGFCYSLSSNIQKMGNSKSFFFFRIKLQ